MTEQEKRMEAAGWNKCYWLGYGNLQTEYDYEPSEELVAECGDDVLKLDEEEIEYFVSEEALNPDWNDCIDTFIKDPDRYVWNWLTNLMRMEPLENEFLERAKKSIGKGMLYTVNTYRANEIDDENRKGYSEDLEAIVKGIAE